PPQRLEDMKKIFPLIVVLITLSVIGILFIQMSWINNAIKLRHEEFSREVDNSLKQTAEAVQNQFLSKQGTILLGKESRQFYLQHNFTTQGWFTRDELYDIIKSVLRQNNISQPFEFSIYNIFKYPVFASEGYKPT